MSTFREVTSGRFASIPFLPFLGFDSPPKEGVLHPVDCKLCFPLSAHLTCNKGVGMDNCDCESFFSSPAHLRCKKGVGSANLVRITHVDCALLYRLFVRLSSKKGLGSLSDLELEIHFLRPFHILRKTTV